MTAPDTSFAASNASCNLVDTINATALNSCSQHDPSINAHDSRTSHLINSTSQSIRWSTSQAPLVDSTQCHLAVYTQVPKCTLQDPVKENEGCDFTALSSEEISESCFSTNTGVIWLGHPCCRFNLSHVSAAVTPRIIYFYYRICIYRSKLSKKTKMKKTSLAGTAAMFEIILACT